MTEKKLKVPDIVRLTELPDSTIRSILTRKSKTVALEVAFKLSKGLNVSLERLNGEESNQIITSTNNTLTKRFKNDEISLRKEQIFEIIDTLDEKQIQAISSFLKYLQEEKEVTYLNNTKKEPKEKLISMPAVAYDGDGVAFCQHTKEQLEEGRKIADKIKYKTE